MKMRVVDCTTENHGEESDGGFTYDVFVSFQGEDTRHNFTGHLVKRLREKGIKVFFDEDILEIGKGISSALPRAIEDSKISIVVFSKNYASSKWCLLELEKIIACTENNKKQLAFPIFYHVDPSDIRNQKNSYDDAMNYHQKLLGKDSDKIKGYRSALSKAGDLTGQHIDTGSEAKHIEEIVEKVCACIAPKPLHVDDDDVVGLKLHIEKVKPLLGLKDNNRCMLVIYGPGRVGKSKLAQVLYNEIVHEFDGASFLANVGVNSKKKGNEYLQKTLLSEMSEPLNSKLGSTCKGISEMKKRLQHKKVLLVLDGVDNIEQLKELAGKGDWFGLGSRIIVTTRDKSVVDRHHQFDKFSYYKMSSELNDQRHSLELFCQKAFKNNHLKRGYEEVSARAVSYAKGLPSTIEAMASSLSTKECLKDWQDAMDDYERVPHKIQDVLRISKDALENYSQIVFVDIECLSKWVKKEYRNNLRRTNRVTPGSECIGLNKSLDYYCGNAAKDTKTGWMMQELCLPQHNGINVVEQAIELLHRLSRCEGPIFRSYDCKSCKRGFTSFQALGGHMNIHKRDKDIAKVEAEEVIDMPNNSLEEEVSPLRRTFNQIPLHTNYKPKLSDLAAESVTKPNPTDSSSSTYYNQNTISTWSKYGLDTCKFLVIFEKGEILDFQRLDNMRSKKKTRQYRCNFINKIVHVFGSII